MEVCILFLPCASVCPSAPHVLHMDGLIIQSLLNFTHVNLKLPDQTQAYNIVIEMTWCNFSGC